MKNRILHLLSLLVLTITISACNKEQWKETVPTNVSIESVNTTVSFGVNTLTIDTIIVNLESMVLDGNRIQADNIHLSQAVNQEFVIVGSSTIQINSFDVPQGSYESFQLTSKIGGNTPSITLIGEYTLANNDVKKVVVSIDYNEFLLRQLVEDSSNPISIDTDYPGNIRISIDPNILFDNLNPSHWNAANPTVIAGQSAIQISNAANSNMYNQIQPKIGESMVFNFE